MKRTVIIFSLAFLLLILAIWEQTFLNKTLSELTIKGEELVDIIKTSDIDNSLNYANNLDKYWQQKERWVCLVINHEDIEELAEQILKVIDKLNANDIDGALAEANLFVFHVHGCKHLLVSSIQNVF